MASPSQNTINVICSGFTSCWESAETIQNHGMSVVYQRLEANKDVEHRSKSGSWKQRVTPKLDLIPDQYSTVEFQRVRDW